MEPGGFWESGVDPKRFRLAESDVEVLSWSMDMDWAAVVRCCFEEVSRFGVDSGVRVRVLFLDFCWVGLEEGDERTEREGSTRVEGEN